MTAKTQGADLKTELISDPMVFRGLGPRWDALNDATAESVFLTHAWLDAWWRAFRGIDSLWILTASAGDELVAAWPLHLRAPGSTTAGSDLQVLGDLGGAQRSMLYRAGSEKILARKWLDLLLGQKQWDTLDVPLVAREMAAAFSEALAERGGGAEMTLERVPGRFFVEDPAELEGAARSAELNFKIADDPHYGLGELLRLMRVASAERDVTGPAADPQTVKFLGEIIAWMAKSERGRIGLLTDPKRGTVAADLVVVDRGRHVQLLRGTDPAFAFAGVSEALNVASAAYALSAGGRRFEFFDEGGPSSPSLGRAERASQDSTLGQNRVAVQRLRLWNQTTRGRLRRSVDALRDVVRSPSGKSDVLGALGKLDRIHRAAPEAVQRAVSRLGNYVTLHLYRGELFVRRPRVRPGLQIGFVTGEEFEKMSAEERETFLTRLELQENYCQQKWRRGDLVVYARVENRPAGILWCAKSHVFVPDIARKVLPLQGESYIHDVYVHPDERGREVAPAMLEFLALKLREGDVYRAWALIERSNLSSIRAFEKAGYTSVADVMFAKVGLVSRLVVRPPDAEARKFLGL